MSETIANPPEHFNFARHLLATNEGRANKTALIDDAGTLAYGQLAEQVQRMSAALSALGLRREDRVLLLMHDCSDWVVSFLAALHAGVVPVAVLRWVPPASRRDLLAPAHDALATLLRGG